MARIAGVNLPVQKHVVIGLQSIFGIGRARSRHVCVAAGVDPATKIKELTEGDVSFRDGSGGDSAKGSLFDVAEVLVELGFKVVTFPDKSKQEFTTVDQAYEVLKALWKAPAVDGGPAGKGIYQKIKTHPKVAAKLAEGAEPEEDVLG